MTPLIPPGIDLEHAINSFLWVAGNIVLAVIFFTSLAFAIVYPLLFKVEETTGGQRIWRAIFSVAGFGLLNYLGLFIDGSVPFTELPPNVAVWRPILRLVIYLMIAHSFAGLVSYLLQRRFWPKKLKMAPMMESMLENELRMYLGTGTGSLDAKAIARALTKSGWVKRSQDMPDQTLNIRPRRYGDSGAD